MSNRRVQTNFRAEDFGASGASQSSPKPKAATPTPEPPADNDVPTGTINEVKTWVGDDKDRAQAALSVENEKETPRSTLVEWLEGVIDAEDDE